MSRNSVTLAAILYLEKISDTRVPMKYLTNIHGYKTLFGTDNLQKLHFVTTLWDEIDEPAGSKREAELKEGHWHAMIAQDANVHRYTHTEASAWAILKGCIEASNRRFDNGVGYDIDDLEGRITETRAMAVSRGDFDQFKSLHQRYKTILTLIRAAVIRGETDDQWAHLRDQLDVLHIQLCEVGDKLKKVPKLSSTFGVHLHRITSNSLMWGTR